MKNFWKNLKEHATKKITYEKKIMLLNTDKNDKNDKNAFKLYHKVRDHFYYSGKYRGAAHNNCNLRYKYQRKFP